MNPLETFLLNCPACGEPLEIVIDLTGGDQSYVEDCQVCCAPMVVSVALGATLGDGPSVTLKREGDV